MRSQMRLAAALWSLNFLTGCTPGRLLQIATSRFAAQDLASSANSGWLLKLSNGVVVTAAASSGVACAVMLLSGSIVKVVIVICPLFRALRGHDMDHSARLETQGNSEQYRRWRTCGDGRRPEPRMIQNSLAFRPQERDACHDRAARVIKENLTMTPSPADGQNCLPTLSLMLPDTPPPLACLHCAATQASVLRDRQILYARLGYPSDGVCCDCETGNACSNCLGESLEYGTYDFGSDRETGYADSGEHKPAKRAVGLGHLMRNADHNQEIGTSGTKV